MICPCCKQPIPHQELGGVYLPPVKAAIYALIKAAPGIDRDGINQRIYGGRVSPHTIRVHICQINDLLADTNYRIRGNIKHAMGEYRVIQLT